MNKFKNGFTNPFAEFPREVGVLVFASFFVAVGFGIIAPTIPLFAKSFGVNNAQVGTIISAFALARFASGLISGKLVDKFGERLVYTVGIAFVAISSFASALAQSYEQLLIFRSAGGLGSSMFSVAAGSIVLRAVRDDQRARAQSLYNGSFLVGMMAGPVIGGFLTAISLRAPLLVYAFLLVVASAAGGFLLRNSVLAARPTEKSTVVKTSMREALAMKPYVIALIISFTTAWVLFGMSRSVLPLFMVEDMKSSASFIGIGFTISAVVQGLYLLRAGRLSDERGRKFSAITGLIYLGISVALLALTFHPWVFLLSMFIGAFGSAFLSTTPSAIVGDVLKGKGGQVIALYQMSGDAGAMVAPVVLGFIADHYGFRSTFAISAALVAVVIVIATKLPETRASHLGQSSK
ncbi:MAG: MFS transporter [Actinobacteria bacterium]|nr:MFS transporter [Actinomycetota bacterium]MSX20543.1 MFS transporter [Actinomycetota bacterium]